MAIEGVPPLPSGMPIVDPKTGAASREFAQWWQQMFGNQGVLEDDITGKADAGDVTASGLTMATSRLLGRDTAGAGAIEELTLSEALDLIGSAAQGDILYRGASAWSRLAAGTNGHVLTLASGVPSWAAASGGGGSSSEASFTAPPALSNWTQQNFDATYTSAVDETDPLSSVRLIEDNHAYGNSNRLRALLRNIPSTNWRVTARLRRHTGCSSYMTYGLVVRDSASSRSIVFGYGYEANGLGQQRFSSDTAYAGYTSYSWGRPRFDTDFWLRLTYDGTDCEFQISFDGVYFRRVVLFSSTALWGYLTNAATDVGFGYNANNNGSGGIGQEIELLSWDEESLP